MTPVQDDRACSPEETLARVTPFLPVMGITRVADITGLDRLGIPVAMAVRPNARSISVSQGKGLTLAAAKVAAVMESLETWHAENVSLPLRHASYEDLRYRHTVMDPERLTMPLESAFDPLERLLWVEAEDLLAPGARFMVPYELASADYSEPDIPGVGSFYASTNGLASGNTLEEATRHAILEIVERDAVALWAAGTPEEIAASAVDPASIARSPVRDLIDRLKQAGLEISLWDVGGDLGVPCYACLLRGPETEPAEFGSAANADPYRALMSAVLEAVQVRTTVISGSRDDIHQAEYEPDALDARREWAADLAATAQTPGRRFPAQPSDPVSLDALLAHLSAVGVEHILRLDLTHPQLRVPVARVIIPDLEGPWEGGALECLPGPRLEEALAAREEGL